MGLPIESDNLKNYNVRKKSLHFIFMCCFFSKPLCCSLHNLVSSPGEELSVSSFQC